MPFAERQIIRMKDLLTTDQLQRELSFRVAVVIAGQMLKDEMITSADYVQIRTFMAKRLKPVWGDLYQV